MRVIITGASRGIGRGIARVLAGDGCEVGLLARSREDLESVRSEVEADGGRAFVATCDIRHADETERAIDALVRELGGVDALVSNAGLVIRKDVLSISLEEWKAMIETNVDGPFHAIRAVLPHLVAQKRGHLINISSISGRLPLAGGSAYAASKYALTGFSESLFLELRTHGIKVTTIFPGSVDTASHRHDPAADRSWKIRPEDVGRACRDVLRTSPENCISRVEIRPLRTPPA